MNFKTEELVPIVAELADKYTGKESTSITYEKARQLMGAVLYCIHQYDTEQGENRELLSLAERQDAKEVYVLGYEKLLKKVKECQILYNKIVPEFHCYGSRCYYDTFIKGIPAFFLYYDPRFQPQNHILTLDYPVLLPLDSLSGIDVIHLFVTCVELEQDFLKKLPEEYIFHVLRAYSPDYRELFINVPSVVLRNILACGLGGKRVWTQGYTQGELDQLIDFVNQNSAASLEQNLERLVEELVESGYDGMKEMKDYLKADLHDFSFELKNAVDNRCLEMILAI